MESDKEVSQSSDSPILEARGIGRRLSQGDGWLFRHVSLAVRSGERVALIGSTGSGKTLLLRSLALLDPLDTGEVRWNGQAISSGMVPHFRRRIIYLHQRPPLFAGTVEENLRQPLALRIHCGKPFDKLRILHLLSDVGRDEEFLAKLSRNLSGGERQLTALLRAIQLDPVLLLLDEPTAALDAATSRAVEKLIHNWQAQDYRRRAFVWVSHEAEQVRRIGDRILTIQAGQLTEES